MTTIAAAAVSALLIAQTSADVEFEADFQEETPRDNYVLSARGPAAGEHAIGLGGSLLLVLPSFDARWIYAVSSSLQTDLQLKTVGVLTVVDTTVRYLLVNGERFSLALRGGAQTQGVIFESGDDSVTGLMVSFGGGLMLSFGPEWLQWTFNNESYVGYSTGSGREVVFLNNSLGVEFPVADTRNMFIEARALTAFHPGQDPIALPMLSLGVGF